MPDDTLVAWPQLLPPWVTAEVALHDWRGRLARVEAQETAHFARLPYVRGVAVIGSVGRGTQWPLSDVDLLIVADPVQGADPEDFVRAEEEQRNRLLDADRVPNDVEASDWVLTAEDVRGAARADDAAFLRMLAHPHWLGLVIKAEGARVAYDPEAIIRPFLDRCQKVLWSDVFLSLWLAAEVHEQQRNLELAASCIAGRDWGRACRTLLRDDGAPGWYATWRRLPQSIARGATRFLRAAQEMGEPEIAELFLAANRLREEEVWTRFAAAPPQARLERDVWLAARRGAGEDVGTLQATRDLLHVGRFSALWSERAEAWPAWAGVSDDEATVRAQCAAAEEMLRRLEATR